MPTGVEHHVDWIADCMTHMRDRGLDFIEAEAEAEDQWVEHSAQVANATLYPKANSWYVGANIPGKPRRFSVYLGGFGSYAKHCERIAHDDYEGFLLRVSPASTRQEVPSVARAALSD